MPVKFHLAKLTGSVTLNDIVNAVEGLPRD